MMASVPSASRIHVSDWGRYKSIYCPDTNITSFNFKIAQIQTHFLTQNVTLETVNKRIHLDMIPSCPLMGDHCAIFISLTSILPPHISRTNLSEILIPLTSLR